jgi:hypothetical protein
MLVKTKRRYVAASYPWWLSSFVHSLLVGGPIGYGFLTFLWWLAGYEINVPLAIVMLTSAFLGVVMTVARALYRRRLQALHPNDFLRFV